MGTCSFCYKSLTCLPSVVLLPVLAAAALLSAGLRLQPEPPGAVSSFEAAAGPASGGRTASALAHLT